VPSHFNNMDLILGTLALLLGLIFVLAATLEARQAKKNPFLDCLDSEYDRPQPRRSSREDPEDDYPLRQTSLKSPRINENDPFDWPPK